MKLDMAQSQSVPNKLVSFLPPQLTYSYFEAPRFCGHTLHFEGIEPDLQGSTPPCAVTLQILLDDAHHASHGPTFVAHHTSLLNKVHPNVLRILEVSQKSLSLSEIQELKNLVRPDQHKYFPDITRSIILIKTDPSGSPLSSWITDNYNKLISESLIRFHLAQMQVEISLGLVEGLRFLHKNDIIHGILTTYNLVFDTSRYLLPIKICMHSSETNYYEEPPERRRDEFPYGHVSKEGDVFSCGTILMQVLQLLPSSIQGYSSQTGRAPRIPEFHEVKDHPVISNAKTVITAMRRDAPGDRITIDEVRFTFNEISSPSVIGSAPTSTMDDSLNKLISLLQDPDGSRWFQNLTFKKELGSGAFGRVLEAFDTRLQRPSAVKIMIRDEDPNSSDSTSSGSTGGEDLSHEFVNTEPCYHINLVKLYQFKQKTLKWSEMLKIFGGGNQFSELLRRFARDAIIRRTDTVELTCIEMELCGPTLRQWIDDKNKATFNRDMFQLRIVQGMVEGLKYLHKIGITHRDLRPENIFFSPNCPQVDPEEGVVYALPIKIGDFGLSKVNRVDFDSGSEDKPPLSGVGNLTYRAPEVGKHSGDWKQADIFSLGLIIWETCQQIEPSQKHGHFVGLVELGKTQLVLPHPLISNFQKVIIQMTQKDPALRPLSLNKVIITCGQMGDILYPKNTQELIAILSSCPEECIIQLSHGVYTGPFALSRPRVTIKGQSPKGTIITNINHPSVKSQHEPILAIRSRYCITQDLKFINTNPKGYSLQIDGIGCSGQNLHFVGGLICLRVIETSATLTNLKIKNASDTGVSINGSYCDISSVSIVNTRLGIATGSKTTNCTLDAIHVANCIMGIEISGNSTIITNVIVQPTNNRKHTLPRYGILMHCSENNTISGLRVEGLSRAQGDWVISLDCKTQGCKIIDGKWGPGPIQIDGCNHTLEDVESDFMDVGGKNHSFKNCKIREVHNTDYFGEILGENCEFGDIIDKREGRFAAIDAEYYRGQGLYNRLKF